MREKLTCPAEFKDLSEAGAFSGYASIFGNVDLGGDIVERGAFEQIEKTRDGKVRIFDHHNMKSIVGKANVEQDDRGLKFNGQLILQVAKAREVYELMKAGVLDGMSIGYDVLENGSEMTTGGVRKLKRLKLWEISTVTFGMNPLAKVENVKGRESYKTIREFEDALREKLGFSTNDARLIASAGYKSLEAARDVPGDGLGQLTDFVKSFKLDGQRDVGPEKLSDVLDFVRGLKVA